MKRLLGISLALLMVVGLVFIGDTISSNGSLAAKAQTTKIKRKTKNVGEKTWEGTKTTTHKTKRGTKWTAHKTKRGTKSGYYKTKRGTKWTAHKTKRGTKAVFSKTKKIFH